MGMPSPLTTRSYPWDTTSLSGTRRMRPSREGTSTEVPAVSAWCSGMRRAVTRSSPCRWNRGWGVCLTTKTRSWAGRPGSSSPLPCSGGEGGGGGRQGGQGGWQGGGGDGRQLGGGCVAEPAAAGCQQAGGDHGCSRGRQWAPPPSVPLPPHHYPKHLAAPPCPSNLQPLPHPPVHPLTPPFPPPPPPHPPPPPPPAHPYPPTHLKGDPRPFFPPRLDRDLQHLLHWHRLAGGPIHDVARHLALLGAACTAGTAGAAGVWGSRGVQATAGLTAAHRRSYGRHTGVLSCLPACTPPPPRLYPHSSQPPDAGVPT